MLKIVDTDSHKRIMAIVNEIHRKEVANLNTERLKTVIDESGMTMSAVAEKSGILRETLYNKLKTGNFYASEVNALSRVLHLSTEERDAIFFGD